ncbi:MAG: ABC transporter substrate-binding protein [Fimbriimonadales bacterium]
MKLAVGIALAALLMVVGCSGQKQEEGGQTGSTSPTGKKIVVGFSQIGAESGWRTANTESIKSEAAKRGIELRFSDAQQKQENQIKALRSFIAQKVDVIMFSPVVEAGWGPVMQEIKDAGIPVIVADRRPDVSEDMYVTFIGSDFVEEGRRAARWLAEKMNGKANILELQGTPGSAPAIDRKKGFEEILKDHPGMKIVLSQSGDFTRAGGKQAMEAFLKSPVGRTANALFAHNDDMALGAIQAIEEAGLKPGKDIIIVSIDGVRGAFEAMVAGKLNCTVECNPIIGPQLFDAVEAVIAGKPLPKRIVVEEGVYDQSVAVKELPNRKY